MVDVRAKLETGIDHDAEAFIFLLAKEQSCDADSAARSMAAIQALENIEQKGIQTLLHVIMKAKLEKVAKALPPSMARNHAKGSETRA